ncbi:MAG: class I adenylate-forming enzyme family protein [Sulfitobacter sp.]
MAPHRSHLSIGPSPNPFNLAAHVLALADDLHDKVALSMVSPDGQFDWTYGDVQRAVRGIATGLVQAGFAPGDVLLMRLGNTVDFPLCYLGALTAGMVPVPTSAALTEAEVTKIITDIAPRAILRDMDVPCPAFDTTITVPELQVMWDLPAADWQMGDADRLGYVIYTSGTSGKPAAVMHAHRAIWARQMMFDGWYGLRRSDRVLHAGAFNWTYTLGTGLMDPWTMGATALIPVPGTKAADIPALLARHKATIFAAAPGVYRQILADYDAPLNLPHLRHGLSAGEKMSDAIKTAWQQRSGTAVYEAFGMSECSTFISSSPATPAQGAAIGKPQPGRRVAILGNDGPLPSQTPGTIAIHRDDPGLMLGYLGAPEQTAARYQGEWFLTGDQGVMDGHGQITYLGRNDDMMNAGGFRVSPLEVEAALADAPGVDGIGVCQVQVKPDVFVIAAFYTAATALDEAALHRYAETKLARYKQPRLYVHLPALPLGANGKLLRRSLRAAYEA